MLFKFDCEGLSIFSLRSIALMPVVGRARIFSISSTTTLVLMLKTSLLTGVALPPNPAAFDWAIEVLILGEVILTCS